MTLISNPLTTFNAPNFEGDLYNITPEDTPLLATIGGLYGGDPVTSTVFSWQEHDLRDAGQNGAKEGQDTPGGTGRARANKFNVLQIIHEGLDVSYTKNAAFGQVSDVGSSHPNIHATGQGPVVLDELQWQIDQRLKEVARDVEYSLINGLLVEPSDNNTARQTGGLLEATVTNHIDVAVGSDSTESGSSSSDDIIRAAGHGLSNGDKIQFTALTGGAGLEINVTYYVVSATTGTFQVATSAGGTPVNFTSDIASGTFEEVRDLTSDDVLDLMQSVWDNGGITEQETAVIIANSWNKRKLTEEFLGVSTAGFRQDERTVGGVNLQTFDTDFGRVNAMLNRYIPKNTVAVASLNELRIKWLLLGGGGTLIIEPLGRIGAKFQSQIYGEFGLQYGNQRAHGKLTGLSSR